jgi:ethanolamine utilization microcompartment shell protein EutL
MAPPEQKGGVELRAYCFIDRMQPQWAALNGTTVSGDIPVAGMAELLIELAPGNEVFRVADVALKATEVKPGSMIVEREFGMLELHAFNQEAVREAGRAVLETLGLSEADRHAPRVASTQLITNVDPYQAQLINRFRRGSMLVPGETLFILEVAPAAYVSLAANEAEKAANIKVVNVSNVGRFGRMFLSGSEAEALNAQQASVRAIEALAAHA